MVALDDKRCCPEVEHEHPNGEGSPREAHHGLVREVCQQVAVELSVALVPGINITRIMGERGPGKSGRTSSV